MVLPTEQQEERWRAEADALWLEGSFRFSGAALLLGEIIRATRGTPLTDSAREALPSIQAAAGSSTDEFRRSVARRRFGTVRDELNSKSTRQPFGRRALFDRAPPEDSPAAPGSREDRALLGLPLTGDLTAHDVQAAFRKLALTAHPDAGGDTDVFIGLVVARDALLKVV